MDRRIDRPDDQRFRFDRDAERDDGVEPGRQLRRCGNVHPCAHKRYVSEFQLVADQQLQQFIVWLDHLPRRWRNNRRWQLDLHLAQGLPLQVLAQPRLIVMEGEAGRVEVGGDPASRQLSLEITARRASAAFPTAIPATR